MPYQRGPAADVIDVTNEDAIVSSIGKAVMVTGKVRHSDSSPKTSDVQSLVL